MSCRTRPLIVAPLLAGLAVAPATHAQQHYDYHCITAAASLAITTAVTAVAGLAITITPALQ